MSSTRSASLQPAAAQPIRAALGSFLGTLIEWFDFYIYATASALIFSHVFFPGSSQLVGTLSSFATLAVGFFARPLGGIIFGHLGDRFGRKYSLILTLFMMGGATVGIGLLPSYAQIGFMAPVLLVLLRVLQGIAVGGEWGGAVLLASEHAPERRKSFYASFAQLGSPAGLVLSLLTFRYISSLPEADMLAWGWRLPFLGSVLLLLLAFLIRRGVNESPEFEARRKDIAARTEQQSPVKTVVRESWPLILLVMGACTIGISSAYFTNTFMIAYATQFMGIKSQVILECLSVVAIVQLINQPIAAWLADKVGAGRFLLLVSAISIFVPYLMFNLVGTGQSLMIILGISLTKIFSSAFYAVIAGYIVDIFPLHQRYSGISLAYQGCGALIGGTTPMLGTLIAGQFGGQWWPLAVFYSALALTSFVCVLLLMRRRAQGGRG
ncbi:LysR family transcriptional regulator [Pseudomonas protegens]|uniref:MFS transporter n=1 Tax=Pseudomonas protegens TaxID=380021 RepID=UPI000F4C9FAA|nr:MFS transporter [Pseudomonas protegens]ROL76173.1 LysR family transcriptional regulator [Pseudomonas protegens]